MSAKPETLPPLPEGKAVVRGPVSAFRDPESGTLVDFDCEGPLSHDPEDGEELFTADQMREYARAALLAADGPKLRVQEIPLSEEQRKMLSVSGDVSIPGADGNAGGEAVAYKDAENANGITWLTLLVPDGALLYTRPQQAAQVAQPHERQLEIAKMERDHAREQYNRSITLLTGIHSLMYPPKIALPDGRVMVFRPSSLDPHEVLQELSDRIRAIPDEIAAHGIGKDQAA